VVTKVLPQAREGRLGREDAGSGAIGRPRRQERMSPLCRVVSSMHARCRRGSGIPARRTRCAPRQRYLSQRACPVSSAGRRPTAALVKSIVSARGPALLVQRVRGTAASRRAGIRRRNVAD
jgi:hypothetical protein